LNYKPGKQGFAGDLAQVVRGVLMGGADIIPGVSGGTVALILGIYRRLVTALSRADVIFLGHIRRFEIAVAARHIDLRFLVTLGLGIVIGIVSLANLMHHLLEDDKLRPLTLAAFFGMILASGLLVGRMVTRWNLGSLALAVGGALFAFWLTGLQAMSVEPSLGYTFICGSIAICAMILPGISGAYILLLMGMYLHVTSAIKGLPRGEFDSANLLTIAFFCAGAGIGLLGFSKLLHRLLERHGSATMALLGGFMIGSLRKIWPFKVDTTPQVVELKLKQFANIWPESFESAHVLAVAIALGGLILVLALDAISRKLLHRPDLKIGDD